MTARTSYLHLYSELARENAKQLASVEAQFHALESKGAGTGSLDDLHALEFDLNALEGAIAKHALTVIVFTAMAVEAYCYDYAARHLSDKYARDYVDKLDLIGKLVVIPRLVTGRELPRNKKWFSLAKDMVKARNSIVHNKSLDIPGAGAEAKKHFAAIQKKESQILQSARQSIELLELLVAEIGELDPDESVWIESYLAGKSNHLEAQ
jgi:hypothetical protein